MFARRKDTTQKPIVDDLRRCGYVVIVNPDGMDVDVRRPTWIRNVWVKLEIKTPNRADGSYKPRKDQQAQIDFCHAHGVPYILCTEQAIAYLDVRGIELEEH